VPRSQAPLRLVPLGEQTSFLDDVYRRSPVPCAVVNAVPVDVVVDVDVDSDAA